MSSNDAVQHVDPHAPLQVTAAAVRHFRQQIQSARAGGIRLSVKESGCTGYMYVMDLVDQPGSNDLPLACGDDVQLFVDRGSLPILTGTRVDYVQEGLNSVLRFENPNAQDHCGCGESFNVKEAGG